MDGTSGSGQHQVVNWHCTSKVETEQNAGEYPWALNTVSIVQVISIMIPPCRTDFPAHEDLAYVTPGH